MADAPSWMTSPRRGVCAYTIYLLAMRRFPLLLSSGLTARIYVKLVAHGKMAIFSLSSLLLSFSLSLLFFCVCGFFFFLQRLIVWIFEADNSFNIYIREIRAHFHIAISKSLWCALLGIFFFYPTLTYIFEDFIANVCNNLKKKLFFK